MEPVRYTGKTRQKSRRLTNPSKHEVLSTTHPRHRCPESTGSNPYIVLHLDVTKMKGPLELAPLGKERGETDYTPPRLKVNLKRRRRGGKEGERRGRERGPRSLLYRVGQGEVVGTDVGRRTVDDSVKQSSCGSTTVPESSTSRKRRVRDRHDRRCPLGTP